MEAEVTETGRETEIQQQITFLHECAVQALDAAKHLQDNLAPILRIVSNPDKKPCSKEVKKTISIFGGRLSTIHDTVKDALAILNDCLDRSEI